MAELTEELEEQLGKISDLEKIVAVLEEQRKAREAKGGGEGGLPREGKGKRHNRGTRENEEAERFIAKQTLGAISEFVSGGSDNAREGRRGLAAGTQTRHWYHLCRPRAWTQGHKINYDVLRILNVATTTASTSASFVAMSPAAPSPALPYSVSSLSLVKRPPKGDEEGVFSEISPAAGLSMTSGLSSVLSPSLSQCEASAAGTTKANPPSFKWPKVDSGRTMKQCRNSSL